MNIICLFEQELKSNTYIAFISPSYAGNHVNECEFKILQSDLEDYDIPVFKDYDKAHKFSYSQLMSEEDYNQTF
jgi:hypothetical protein